MVLTDQAAYYQVLGAFIKNPGLLLEVESDLSPQDFDTELPRIVYTAIYNLIHNGVEKLTPFEIDSYIRSQDILKVRYEKLNGLQYIQDLTDFSNEENFSYYYTRVKKLALLRELKKQGYNISNYYQEDFKSTREEAETNERFDNATLQEILDHVESNFSEIRHRFISGLSESQEIQHGVQELVEGFLITPEIGRNLNGIIFSTVVRGARLGKFFVRSASSGTGKSRQSFFDAAYLAFPERWDHSANQFIKENREPQNTLIVTTEMPADEVQTIVLAYLSGVNEDHILDGKYLPGEYNRILYGIEIMKKYPKVLFIERIADPNLNNARAAIKKHAVANGVKYVFYDYVFSSPSLLSQFSALKVREDVALGLLCNMLKEVAQEYNLFILTSSQLNADGMRDGGPRNELSLRGAKSLIDKADIGLIISEVTNEELERFKLAAGNDGDANPTLLMTYGMPTHVLDIYKNRRGRYKDVRVWFQTDLGTGFRRDLFMTDRNYRLINLELTSDVPEAEYFMPTEADISSRARTEKKEILSINFEDKSNIFGDDWSDMI